MRIGALAAEFRALFDAEAVLFVNDDELQIREHGTGSSMTACVPMTILIVPFASPLRISSFSDSGVSPTNRRISALLERPALHPPSKVW
ncbi:MAG: hypothetical protein M0C28_33685 [Candidatus Moduliflexus flocculans]|nr:hypothetical protein [Candidatus Moduliflexus flocculans]